MRALPWLLVGGVVLSACSAQTPTQTPTASPAVDCQLGTAQDCDLALGVASASLRHEGRGVPARVVVTWGRAPARTWHAEVHACFADGEYLLIDDIGPIAGRPTASLRQNGWASPPCR